MNTNDVIASSGGAKQSQQGTGRKYCLSPETADCFVGLQPPRNDGAPLNFSELFHNANPVEIEIGCGRGKFLIARAGENPAVNFLGLDRVAKWMKRGIKKSEKMENILLMKADVREFLAQVPAESISAFHIYFPDPWPKRRHRKRRLVNPDFLQVLERKLSRGRCIQLATDDADYFEQMKKSAAATASLWSAVRETRNARIQDPHLRTNYELKFETEGRDLFYLELVK